MSEDYCAMKGVVPHLTIRDNRAAEAIDFYTRAFGASESGRHMAEDGKRIMHAHLDLNGGPLMLNDDFPEMMGGAAPAPAGVGLHLDVPDADAAWEKALAAGATVRFALDNQFWGQRYGQVTDPFGHIWSIGGPVTES
ncbi:MAG: VOC family protein [Sphingopyxis sp.]|uniref:VOC family protein n=1 Tax=Sphingopyxis sp. TaxID=1908224 RepID=UPI0032F038E1